MLIITLYQAQKEIALITYILGALKVSALFTITTIQLIYLYALAKGALSFSSLTISITILLLSITSYITTFISSLILMLYLMSTILFLISTLTILITFIVSLALSFALVYIILSALQIVVRSSIISVLPIIVRVPIIIVFTWFASIAQPYKRSMQVEVTQHLNNVSLILQIVFNVLQRYLVSSVACLQSLRGQSTPKNHRIAILVQLRQVTRPT